MATKVSKPGAKNKMVRTTGGSASTKRLYKNANTLGRSVSKGK